MSRIGSGGCADSPPRLFGEPGSETYVDLRRALEDLEDVGRTSELAESDLDALHAVAGSMKTFVVRYQRSTERRYYHPNAEGTSNDDQFRSYESSLSGGH